MRRKGYDPFYNEDVDYNVNAPSFFEKLGKDQKLLKELAKLIWEYDKTLTDSLENLEIRLTHYVELWEQNLLEFDDEVIRLLVGWLEDGVLDDIINVEIFNHKLDTTIFEQFRDSITAQLQQIGVLLEDYGTSIGDGVNDDSISFRQALNDLRDLGGGMLHLPKNKTLLFKSTIDKMTLYNGYYAAELFSNITIIGYNTTIKLDDGFTNRTEYGNSSGGNVFIADNAKNITITGVTFDYNGQNNPQPTAPLRTAYGMVFVGGENVTITDCHFNNHPGNNCLLFKRQNLKYEIQPTHRNCKVIDCTFHSFGSDVPNNDNKIDTSAIFSEWEESLFKRLKITNRFEPTGGRGGIELHASDQMIEDCYFEKCFPAIYMCNDYTTSQVVNQVVRNNNIQDCHGGITFWNTGDVTFFIIEDNIINCTKSGSLIGNPGAIYQFTNAPDYTAITDGVIRNNTIYEHTTLIRNSNVIKGITLQTFQNIQIINNTMRYLSGEGIALLGNPRIKNSATIEKNTFKNCYTNLDDTSKVYLLLNLTTYTADLKIIDNTFINDFNLTRYAFNFSWSVSVGVDVVVKNNTLTTINKAIGNKASVVKILPMIEIPTNLLGYIADTSGVLTQWTRVTVTEMNTPQTFPFPIAFKDDKISIMATNALDSNNANVSVVSYTADTFTLRSDVANKPFFIRAIGLI